MYRPYAAYRPLAMYRPYAAYRPLDMYGPRAMHTPLAIYGPLAQDYGLKLIAACTAFVHPRYKRSRSSSAIAGVNT